jgi:hypothetical protein
MTEAVGSSVDPARHLISGRWDIELWYEPPPLGTGPAVPLDALVAEWRELIGAERRKEPRPDSVDVVVISAVRARIIAYLLRELSNRLRPGFAAGPIESDGSLSAFITELAEDLKSRSWR